MNYPGTCFTLLMAGILYLTVVIYNKREQEVRLAKYVNFEENRLTDTKDVLLETLMEMSNSESKWDQMKKELEQLIANLVTQRTATKNVELEQDRCTEVANLYVFHCRPFSQSLTIVYGGLTQSTWQGSRPTHLAKTHQPKHICVYLEAGT
ncbi:hypothetical protein AALO_G00172650 [Alosa alosa]|uniref:Uncharacterized protein n=1 Tax=Alosa alosa TaxID=278164 RepID=A0AAV6G6R7_9TELE|nr:hypothetical protein AALO_G00172650 [Alosa alosa]